MKNKKLLIVLGVIFIISVGGNIYQYVVNSNIHNKINSLITTKNELQTEIDNKIEELNSLTSEMESLNMTISELTEKVDSLTTDNELLQNEIVVLQEEIDKQKKSAFDVEDKLTASEQTQQPTPPSDTNAGNASQNGETISEGNLGGPNGFAGISGGLNEGSWGGSLQMGDGHGGEGIHAY